MKNLYTSLSLLMLLGGALPVSAKVITPAEAEQAANRFMASRPAAVLRAPLRTVAPSLVYAGPAAATRTAADEAPYYVFNYGDEAFVLIAGDDRMNAVLGYSDSGAFSPDSIPDNVASWLVMYAGEFDALQRAGEPTRATFAAASTNSYPASVSPLLGDIVWNQDDPYNRLCPTVGGRASYTGCTATALAQIMGYHRYPATGTGSASYTTTTYKLSVSADFSAMTFDWDNMLAAYKSGSFSDVQATAVATLMYACGASVKMDYTPDASGAYCNYVPQALADNFGYDKGAQVLYRSGYTNAEWTDLIKAELSGNRPILYSGYTTSAGHSFVFDGYDANDMVHVNWGWGGSYNGYFRITALNPENVGIGGGNGDVEGYNYTQSMVMGIQKPTSSYEYLSGFRLDSMTVSSNEITKLEPLTVTLYGIYNYGATFPGGRLGIIVEKDGVQTALASYSIGELQTFYGYGSFSFRISFPTQLAAGDYLLYPAVRPTSSSSWQRVRGDVGTDCIYRAAASSVRVSLASYWGDFDMDASLSLSGQLNAGFENTFNLSYSNHNTQTEVYAPAGVAFVSADGSTTEVIELGQLFLEPGATDVAMSYTATVPSSLDEGTYSVIPVVARGSSWVQVGAAVTAEVVKPNTTDDDYWIGYYVGFTTGKSDYEVGESMDVTLSLTNYHSDAIYAKKIAYYIFPEAGGSSLFGKYAEVIVEPKTTKSFTYTITPGLPEGRYFLCAYSDRWLIGTTWTGYTYFNVVNSTGIDEVAARALRVAYLPQADLLRIEAPADARRAEVYDLSGRLALSIALTGEEVQLIDASALPAGSYIVRLQGAVARFVKP